MVRRDRILAFFDSFLWLLTLLVVSGTALVYPLAVGKMAYADKLPWERAHSWKEFVIRSQALPWLTGGISPLVAKETWFLWVMSVFLFLALARWIFRSLHGLESSLLPEGRSLPRRLAASPEIWFLLFLLSAGVGIARSEVFFSSIRTWVCLAAGGLLVIVLRTVRLPITRMVHFMAVVWVVGLILAFIALLQHLGKHLFLPVINDPRNRLGSLIGHNTGLSSWLMFPLSFSIYFLMTNRRIIVRITAFVGLVLVVFVIIAAESRAIWALGGLICLLLPWAILRARFRRMSVTWILLPLLIIAAVSTSQVIDPAKNPLARAPVSLIERIRHDILNLDQLRRETRVRILVVTATELVPSHPLFGTGLGSFSWEYPKAQGSYFQSHPDSWIGTTMKRTDMAHDDWLQLLEECGLVGALLLIGAITACIRAGKKRFEQLTNPRDRAVMAALAAPTLALALHAFVDFPFHIAPIALVGVVSFSFLTTPLPRPAPEPFRLQSRNVSRLLLSLFLPMVLLGWLPMALKTVAWKPFVSDVFYSTGLAWLNTYYTSEPGDDVARLACLEAAHVNFRESVVTNVFNGAAYEGQAISRINKTSVLLDRRQEKTGAAGTSAARKNEAIRSAALSAVSALGNQLHSGGLRYHYTYYLLGKAYRALWMLNPNESDNQQARFRDQAIGAFREAVNYNPADATAMFELSELLRAKRGGETQADKLYKRMFSVNPQTASHMILDPAIQEARIGHTGNAQARLDPVLALLPDDPWVHFAYTKFLFYKAVWPPGTIDRVGSETEALGYRRMILTSAPLHLQIAARNPIIAREIPRWSMLCAAAAGKYQEAFALAGSRLEKDPNDPEAQSVRFWCQKRIYGGGLKYVDSLVYYRTHALLALYFMDERNIAGINLGELAFRKPLTLPEAMRLMAFYRNNNYQKLIDMVLPKILKQYPDVPEFRELKKNASPAQ